MSRSMTNVIYSALLLIVSMFNASWSHAEQTRYDMPSTIDRSANYVFYHHNYYVETKGPDGDCKYYDILKAFTDNGYIVISPLRPKDVSPIAYATKAAADVQALLAAGVPPQNITIAGHSKGAVIALRIASIVDNAKVNYVIMAGCGIKGLSKAYPDFRRLKGNFLSLYATSDTIAGSCKNDFAEAKQNFSGTETALENPLGHQLFFKPMDVWTKPMFEWMKQRKQ